VIETVDKHQGEGVDDSKDENALVRSNIYNSELAIYVLWYDMT
jgi:hypothetical protein